MQTETIIDPCSGTVVTRVLPPKFLYEWLLDNMRQPFRLAGVYNNLVDHSLQFSCEEDASLYRLRWL